jgi:quercetin dioxygenase-like cupin family protein
MSTVSTDTIRIGAIEIRFLVDEGDSAGSVTAFECRIPAGAKAPVPHSHDAFDETVFGLGGVITYTVDGVDHEIGAGEALFIPRGVVHGFVNATDEEAVFLAMSTPGIFGPAYFREMGDVVAAAAGAPPDTGALMEVMRRHGLTPAPPSH